MQLIGNPGTVAARAALLLLAAGLAPVASAAAQAAADVSETDLQVNLRVVSTSPGITGEAAAMVNTLGGLLAKVVGVDDANAIGEELNLPKPETSTMDYVVKIKGNRIRVDMGGSALLGRLAPDGSVSEWGILDPKTNRVMNTWVFDQAVRNPEVAFSAFPGEYEVQRATITAQAGTKAIAGYPARPYDYTRESHFYPVGRKTGAPELIVKVTGSAWLARFEDVPDADAALFFRLWASSFNGQESGPLSVVPELEEKGLLLESKETTTIYLFAYDETQSAALTELMSGTTTTTVTGLDRPTLDPALFAGFDAGKQECDCSCDTWKKMQAIGELPKDEIEKHPEAMKMAMCMPKCVGAFMACGKKKN